nr:type II secretion system minor pseudopilin GspI [Providencia alcalifaciens]
MNMQKGMTLLEVMVALVVFALAGIALMKTTAQQVRGISWMEDKILASWLADNQMVQLHLDKVWSDKNWNEKTVYFAGKEWYLRWRGESNETVQQSALDVEVWHNKEDKSAVISLRSYVGCEWPDN